MAHIQKRMLHQYGLESKKKYIKGFLSEKKDGIKKVAKVKKRKENSFYLELNLRPCSEHADH